MLEYSIGNLTSEVSAVSWESGRRRFYRDFLKNEELKYFHI